MLSKSLENAINDQVTFEFYSSYTYLAMAAYCESIDLSGFANFFKVQAKEKSYENILDGKWITNGDYGVIHRIAVDNTHKGKGLSHKIIKYAEEVCKQNNIHSIKVDTHEDNILMQSLDFNSSFNR